MPITAKHGTRSGYNAHKRKGEDPCTACVKGNREEERVRKQAQRAKKSGTKSKGVPMNSIEDHERIIADLERTIDILNQAIETEEPKSNRNLSGLAKALLSLHAEVADRKAAVAELRALDNESEAETPDDIFDIFARSLHQISVSDTEDSQDVPLIHEDLR